MATDFNRNIQDTAVYLNENDLSTRDYANKIDESRVQDANRRGWTNGRKAASIGVSERRLRQKKQAPPQNTTDGGRAFEAVLIDLFGSRDNVRTLDELLQHMSSRLDAEQLKAVLNSGIKEGYFEKVEGTKAGGSDGGQQYRWTGERYLHRDAVSQLERHERSKRALSIVERGVICAEIVGNLTVEGVRRMRDFMNPQKKEACTYQLLKESADRSRQRGLGGSTDANYGVVHLLSVADGRSPAMICADHEDETVKILPSREFLANEERAEFEVQSLPLVIEQARKVMSDAEQLGDGERVKFRLQIVAGDVVEATQTIPATFRKALATALLLLIPFVASFHEHGRTTTGFFEHGGDVGTNH